MLLLLALSVFAGTPKEDIALVTVTEVESGKVVFSLMRSAADDPAFPFGWGGDLYTVQGDGETCLFHSELSGGTLGGVVPEGSIPSHRLLCRPWGESYEGLPVPAEPGLEWSVKMVTPQ